MAMDNIHNKSLTYMALRKILISPILCFFFFIFSKKMYSLPETKLNKTVFADVEPKGTGHLKDDDGRVTGHASSSRVFFLLLLGDTPRI